MLYSTYGLRGNGSDLFDRVDRLLNQARARSEQPPASAPTCDWAPAVDIHEEAGRFVLLVDVPGVDPKDIDVTMERNVLSIRGERKVEEHEGYRRSERPAGIFDRQFSLPDTADAERIGARGRHGVLEVVIPKKESVQPKRIAVTH